MAFSKFQQVQLHLLARRLDLLEMGTISTAAKEISPTNPQIVYEFLVKLKNNHPSWGEYYPVIIVLEDVSRRKAKTC